MTFVALAIACAPVALYLLMHHNHDGGHCGWNRCQTSSTLNPTEGDQP